MRHFLISCLVLLSLATAAVADTAPPPPVAPSPEAAQRLERGLRFYATQRYDEALVELRRGYEIDPHPDFLYAIGQAERMRGNCRGAVEAYRAYLRTRPPQAEEARAQAQIERCGIEPSESTSTAAPSFGAARTPASERSFGTVGIAMTAGSAVALGASTWLFVVGGRHARAADSGYTLAERDRERTAARNYRLAGGAALVGGVTLGTLAVLRYLRRGERRAPTVTGSLAADHVYVGAELPF